MGCAGSDAAGDCASGRYLVSCADIVDSKLTTVLCPADPALPISCTHDRYGRRPWNGQVRIVMSYGHIAVRSVKLVDPVDDIGDPGQRLEPVQESARNVDLGADLIVEQEGHDLAECRRAWPGIDNHIEHGAIGAANQLRLARPGSTVQSAAYALIGP